MGIVSKNSIPAKLGLAALAAILVFLGLAVNRETLKKKQVENEINKLKEEAEKIARENSTIQDKLSYLESKDFREREAKDKLNLQSPGENVIVIKPGIAKPPAEESASQPRPMLEEKKMPIFKKWWQYFFNK